MICEYCQGSGKTDPPAYSGETFAYCRHCPQGRRLSDMHSRFGLGVMVVCVIVAVMASTYLYLWTP